MRASPLHLAIIAGITLSVARATSLAGAHLDSKKRYADGTTVSAQLLTRLLVKSDNRIRPNADAGIPVHISCGFYVVSFGSISEVDMDYRLDIYLRQSWRDERLAFSSFSEKTDPFVLSSESIDRIWTPDIFFPNEKSASFHQVTKPNKLLRVYPDGRIDYSVRLTLKLACSMNLQNFPMDQQVCSLRMESYGYEQKDLQLSWYEGVALEISDDLLLPQFDLTDIRTQNGTKLYKTGEFSGLMASFTLRRHYGFFLLQTYVPSILIVILSWVSFWINMDAVPARISLGVTTVLTMATQLSGSKASIPRVSYPKAIDVWMTMCMMFVFLALIEYAFVNALSRAEESPRRDGDGEKMPARGRTFCCCPGRQLASWLDKVSRVFFPFIFIAFNAAYWSIYTLNIL